MSLRLALSVLCYKQENEKFRKQYDDDSGVRASGLYRGFKNMHGSIPPFPLLQDDARQSIEVFSNQSPAAARVRICDGGCGFGDVAWMWPMGIRRLSRSNMLCILIQFSLILAL